jgi:hypothetical protein
MDVKTEMGREIRKVEGYMCYSLNMKCSPQAYILNALLKAGGSIWGGLINFRRWGLDGRIRHSFEGYTYPFLTFSASCLS